MEWLVWNGWSPTKTIQYRQLSESKDGGKAGTHCDHFHPKKGPPSKFDFEKFCCRGLLFHGPTPHSFILLYKDEPYVDPPHVFLMLSSRSRRVGLSLSLSLVTLAPLLLPRMITVIPPSCGAPYTKATFPYLLDPLVKIPRLIFSILDKK